VATTKPKVRETSTWRMESFEKGGAEDLDGTVDRARIWTVWL